MRGTSLPFLSLALLLTIVWVAGPVLAQQLPPSMPGPRTIVAGKSLAGIALTSSIEAVVARFGAPAAVLETDRDRVYVWHRFGVNAYVRDGLVTAVSTSNSLMRAGEVGPGFRVDDAIKVFGAAYQRGTVEGFQGLQFDDQGIAFGIDRKAVAVVLVFSPGQAAQVSGLQRTARFAPSAGPVMLPAQGASPGAASAASAGPMLPAAPVAQVLAGIPFVAGQRAFSTVTNYMSLSGYLRWLVYQSSASWITVSEASRMVQVQRATTVQPRGTTTVQPREQSTAQPQETSTVQSQEQSTAQPQETSTAPPGE